MYTDRGSQNGPRLRVLLFTLAVLTYLIPIPAYAEARSVSQNLKWRLVEFYDGFEERVDGYSASTIGNRLRLDVYLPFGNDADPDNEVFVIMDVARSQRGEIVSTLERSFRFSNPRYPRECDTVEHPDICESFQSADYAAKLELKPNGGNSFVVCDRSLQRQSGHQCDTRGDILGSCYTTFGSATPSQARNCVSNLAEDGIDFFMPLTRIESIIAGPTKIYARLTIYALDDREEGAEAETLREIELPSISLSGATPIIREFINKAQKHGMLTR